MDANTKKIILIGGVSAVLLSAIAFGAYKLTKKNSHVIIGDKLKPKDGRKLIGKRINYGSEGYVNVRITPKVDNENWGAFDFSHNLIKQVSSNPVGSILSRVKGEDGFFWYKISLSNAVEGKSEGYVREDAVMVED